MGKLHESVADCLLPHCTNSALTDSEQMGTLHNLYLTCEMPLCMILDLSEVYMDSVKMIREMQRWKSIDLCNIQSHTMYSSLSCVAEAERMF